MMKQFERAVIDAYKYSPNIICILLTIFIFLTDILTGEYIHFPIFFVIPAGLAAWQLNKILAYSITVALPFLRVLYFYIYNDGKLDIFSVVNALIIMAALSAYVYLITRITEEMGKRA
ncbi:MAG: hypothetical protein OEL83_09155 [Desulforhopalus sp.]|nr:hypothetical protein [Desulforhopalus sp.]